MPTSPKAGKPTRTAVIGAGYLGKFHVEKYAALPNSELVAVVDTQLQAAQILAERHNVEALSRYQDLFGRVDAVSIATPTSTHYTIARDCLQHGIHVLVEKPITVTVTEADELIEVAAASNVKLQVGHLERFNAAVLALGDALQQPKFIESHRLAPFKLRATDVNVILDLMIHDIDIILNLIKANVIDIEASGAKVMSDSIDIANVRMAFDNGCVANVTASRVSLKAERKMRIFQDERYISIDFQNRILSQHTKVKSGNEAEIPRIESHEQIFDNDDALKTEISAFLRAIETDTMPIVTGEDGRRALQTAIRITELLQ
ncbi:MAG TPA: Gfo/Idh/MocA family oxidoreductase [Gammaproteobacteria bacterium]|jgi:predicted dehydrogenase